MLRKFALFAFLLFVVDTCFAKSCLHDLPSGHHVVVASYDEQNNCIIKSCLATYKLFQNACYSKKEYEDLIRKEKICTTSGGEYKDKSCVCPKTSFLIGNEKCETYDESNCTHLGEHINRNNLSALKRCFDNTKSKGFSGSLLNQAIKLSIKTQDYSIVDFMLDSGISLEAETNSLAMGLMPGYEIALMSVVRGGFSDTDTDTYVVDFKKDLNLIKHLVEEKKAIDLSKKYTVNPKGYSPDTGLFIELVVVEQYSANTANPQDAKEILKYLLEKTDKDVLDNLDILGLMMPRGHGSGDHEGFPLDYFKFARSQGLKFKLSGGNNPMDYLTPLPNLKQAEYSWFISEVKKDLPNVNFTNALKQFCGEDYVYGPPPRTIEEDKEIIKIFLDAGAQINNDVLNAAKDYQTRRNKNAEGVWLSHKFDAVKSFVQNIEDESINTNTDTGSVEDKQKAYDEAKEREQSLANRTLTAVTMAATGIGGMELAQGLSEQKADKDAEQDMMAYMETFRCEYAGGKSVKNGATNVELPADTLFDLYQEYITLAADLKECKEALGLAPGIESEVIIDKATAGLYDDTASEKSNGTYASIYRAKMGNETDQAKLQEMSDTSQKRVTGGAIAAGAGAGVGVIGNSLINGKIGEVIKEKINTPK